MIGAARQTHISKYVEQILQYIGTAGSEFQVNTYTSNNQQNPAVAQTSNGFVIVWQSFGQDGSNEGIYAQRYAVDGTALGSEFRVNTNTGSNQQYPAVSQTSNGFVITWTDSEFNADGDSSGVFAQRYAVDGTALGSEFQVNTYTTSSQLYPAACQTADGFVITWVSSGQDGSSNGVFAQRYAVDGTALGSEFQVNIYYDSIQTYPAASQTATGFVITWQSRNQDGNYEGIYAQRYAVDGTALGSEFRVNTTTTSGQQYPAVAQTSNGFVITWHSYHNSGPDVYAQRYAEDGTALGSEFRVNTYTASDQAHPSVSQTPDGGFVIIWQSRNQDGDGDGIYAQRYAVDGTALGSEFQVNTYTTGYQGLPSGAQTSDGFVITWHSNDQDAVGGRGVYAQRYQYGYI